MIYKIKSFSHKYYEKVCETAIFDLNKFFGLNIENISPNLFLVNDRKTMNDLRQQKTESWVVGWGSPYAVYLLDYRNFLKESNHTYVNKKHYSALIKHEMVHIFTHKVCIGSNPLWLWEGLAIYLSGQLYQYKKPLKLKNFLEFYNKYNNETTDVYKESGFAIKFLVDKFGKEKILELLKSITKDISEIEFARLFKSVYNKLLEYKTFN
jgi:hypothetical protein